MANYYADAIRALHQGNINFEKLGNELAATHPKIFMDLIRPARDTFQVLKKTEWQTEVRRLLVNGDKVDAIKLTRTSTGLGLKEAKDVCDCAMTKIQPMANNNIGPLLDSTLVNLASEIAA